MTTSAFPTTISIESPASWNTRYLDPSGFECQLTLRVETGQDLLERGQGAIAFLLDHGCIPASNGKSFNSHASSTTQSEANGNNGNGHDQSWCPIHNCEMRKWTKDNRIWFSHKVGGEWCSGKPKRN